MTSRGFSLTFSSLLLFAGLPAQAQALRPLPVQTARPLSPASAPAGTQRAADFIVAVVNSEPITNSEVRLEAQRLTQQLAQQRRPSPDSAEIVKVALERMINDRAQLQLARETGIRIDNSALEQAEQNVARQNRIDVPELRRRLAADGISPAQFREQLRDQITLVRLRERDVDSRVRVSDLEVDQFLRDQPLSADPTRQDINIAQILVAVPEAATAEQVAAFQAKAQTALTRARAGEDFPTLARELSDSPDKANGGQLGLRNAERYPPLFLEATQGLGEGGISGLVRSGAGFHVLKLLEKRAAGLSVTQSRARHILLRPSGQMSETQARDTLSDFKRRIQSGQSSFEALARANSQDASAPQGGDLGWANPGQFVPEFEDVMNALTPGQISDPLISRFGVHLIQLVERRTAPLSPKDQREVTRNQLREKKLEDAFLVWTQEVRGRAYIEMREPPQIN
jgi:peptidyl-prolyl cis-trans isomerase SurA